MRSALFWLSLAHELSALLGCVVSGCVTNCRQWQFVRVEKMRVGFKYQKTDVHTLAAGAMDADRMFILSFFYEKPEVLGTIVSSMQSTARVWSSG